MRQFITDSKKTGGLAFFTPMEALGSTTQAGNIFPVTRLGATLRTISPSRIPPGDSGTIVSACRRTMPGYRMAPSPSARPWRDSGRTIHDQVVCYLGVCTVGGVHSSSIWNETVSHTYTSGHFGLLTYTVEQQANLVQ